MPLAAFYFFAALMALLTALATCFEPTADGASLLPPASVADILRSRSSSNADAFNVSVFGFYLVDGLYRIAVRLGLSLFAVRVICVGAWLVHAGEAFYAHTLCRRGRASTSTTVAYVVMTFIGGFGQVIPLKAALQRLEEKNPASR